MFAAAMAIGAAGDAYREEDLGTLRMGTCPEPGTVFAATPLFVPVLIEFLSILRNEDLADTLTAFGDIAAAEFEWDEYCDYDFNVAEQECIAKSHQAVLAGFDRYIQLSAHPAAEVKAASLFVLARIGRLETGSPEETARRYETIPDTLREVLEREQDTVVRVAAVHAMADVGFWPGVENLILRKDVPPELIVAGTLNLLENDLRHDVAPLLRDTFSQFESSEEALDGIEEMFAVLPWNDQALQHLVHVQLDRVETDS